MITEPMKSIVFFMIKTSFFTIFSSILKSLAQKNINFFKKQ